MIGAPYTLKEISQKANYHPCKSPYRIADHLIYLGEIPRINDFEIAYPIGKQQRSGIWEEDYVRDDSALVYQGSKGIFIITGCSHSGICNIIEYAKKVCNEEKILGVLGGFHLFDDDFRLEKTIQYLEACNMKQLYPCHCVSLLAKAKMLERLPVTEVGIGMTVRIV